MKIYLLYILIFYNVSSTKSTQIKKMSTQSKIPSFSHYINGFRNDGRSFYSLSAVTHLYFILAGSKRSQYLSYEKNKFILHNIKFNNINEIENKKRKKQNSLIQCLTDSILFYIIHYIYVDYGKSINAICQNIANARTGHFGIGRNRIQCLREYYNVQNVKTINGDCYRQQYIMILPMKKEVLKNKRGDDIKWFCVPIELIVAKKINITKFSEIQEIILEKVDDILTEKLFSAFIIRFSENSKLFMLNMMRSPGVTTIATILDITCKEISELYNYNCKNANAKQLYPINYSYFKSFVKDSNYFLNKSKIQDIKNKSHNFKNNINKIIKLTNNICDINSWHIFNIKKKNWTQISRQYVNKFISLYKFYSINQKTGKCAKYLARLYSDIYFDELYKSNDINIATQVSNAKIKELFKLFENK